MPNILKFVIFAYGVVMLVLGALPFAEGAADSYSVGVIALSFGMMAIGFVFSKMGTLKSANFFGWPPLQIGIRTPRFTLILAVA